MCYIKCRPTYVVLALVALSTCALMFYTVIFKWDIVAEASEDGHRFRLFERWNIDWYMSVLVWESSSHSAPVAFIIDGDGDKLVRPEIQIVESTLIVIDGKRTVAHLDILQRKLFVFGPELEIVRTSNDILIPDHWNLRL